MKGTKIVLFDSHDYPIGLQYVQEYDSDRSEKKLDPLPSPFLPHFSHRPETKRRAWGRPVQVTGIPTYPNTQPLVRSDPGKTHERSTVMWEYVG